MSNVRLFKPKAELSAEQNLATFEQFCRKELVLFGSDLQFDEDIWDLSATYPVAGSTKRNRAIFSNYDAARAHRELPAMAPQFIGFAKSYFRYSLSLRSSTTWANRLAALRVLEHALQLEGLEGRVSLASHDTFVHACGLIQQGYAASTAPKIAGQLEVIGELLMKMGFSRMNMPWKSPLKRAQEENIRVGQLGDKAREDKLPSRAAIEAIAHIFRNPNSPAERIVTSTVALMYCFPQRINEVMRLSYDCEVDYDQENRPHYGLRALGSKGFEDGIRWILPTMEQVAREAIFNLKDASAAAREIAVWYETNPSKIFLQSEYEYLRSKEFVEPIEAGLMLYGVPRLVKSFLFEEKIKQAKNGCYRFEDIQNAVLDRLPSELRDPLTKEHLEKPPQFWHDVGELIPT